MFALQVQQTINDLIILQLEDGKADIAVTVDELLALLPMRYGDETWYSLRIRDVVVTANVTEAATGETLSGNNTVRCWGKKYNLTFLDITPTTFKPGLSVFAYVCITDRWLKLRI